MPTVSDAQLMAERRELEAKSSRTAAETKRLSDIRVEQLRRAKNEGAVKTDRQDGKQASAGFSTGGGPAKAERVKEASLAELKAELASLYRSAYRGPALGQGQVQRIKELNDEIKSRAGFYNTQLSEAYAQQAELEAKLKKTGGKAANGWDKYDQNNLQAVRTQIREYTKQLGGDTSGAAGAALASRAFKAAAPTGLPTRTFDGGAANTAKVNQVREMLGLGTFAEAGFYSPVVDENSGQLTGYQLSDAYKGFNFGSQAKGLNQQIGQRAGSFVGGRNLDMLTGMSVSEMKDFYMSLTPAELRQVQTEMALAGFYGNGDRPTWGTRDDETENAFVSMMIAWADRPDVNLRQLLDELKRSYSAQLDPNVREVLGTDIDALLADGFENITITDTTTLEQLVDTMSGELLGTGLDPGVKARLIAKLQEQEKAYKMNDATGRFQQSVAQQRAASGRGETAELDAFMGALIGQESGGDPNAVNERTGAAGLGQMMDWSSWAREAGVDPADFSAANQKRVIRYKLAQYYALFGNWRDVAIAWYGGPGAPAEVNSGNWSATRPQGYGNEPSFNEYADSVLSKMNANLQGNLAQGATDPTLNFTVTEDLPSNQARVEAELKALDPSRYYGTKFYKGASTFFNMLRSPF